MESKNFNENFFHNSVLEASDKPTRRTEISNNRNACTRNHPIGRFKVSKNVHGKV